MITLLESQSPQIADIIYFLVAANVSMAAAARSVGFCGLALRAVGGHAVLSDFYKSLIFNGLRFAQKII